MGRFCPENGENPGHRLVLIRMIREPADLEEKDKNRTTHKRTAGKPGFLDFVSIRTINPVFYLVLIDTKCF
jgi:hypothetical protein